MEKELGISEKSKRGCGRGWGILQMVGREGRETVIEVEM
jgi:hypothetical protein